MTNIISTLAQYVYAGTNTTTMAKSALKHLTDKYNGLTNTYETVLYP